MHLKITEQEKKYNKDPEVIKRVVKNSLENSLEKLGLTVSDHRYRQGIYQVLKDLDKFLSD